jgi:hypothetical protein
MKIAALWTGFGCPFVLPIRNESRSSTRLPSARGRQEFAPNDRKVVSRALSGNRPPVRAVRSAEVLRLRITIRNANRDASLRMTGLGEGEGPGSSSASALGRGLWASSPGFLLPASAQSRAEVGHVRAPVREFGYFVDCGSRLASRWVPERCSAKRMPQAVATATQPSPTMSAMNSTVPNPDMA